MIVTAWNNGSFHESGAGYGFKITGSDRDKTFDQKWDYVVLNLEKYPEPVIVNINKSSFWGPTCRELIKKEIGIWLLSNELAPWPKGNPPKLNMNHVSDNRFQIKLKSD